MKIIHYSLFILLFIHAACSVSKHEINQAQLPDSTLIAIRDGFDTRVADLFKDQKGKTLDETFKVDWNESLAHSYPRTAYAAVQFWLNENIDSANIALKEYGQYFIDKPDENRMNVGWHTEMAIRLIEMYGSKGRKSPGLLKPETEKKIMEGIWTNVKGGMGQDPEQVNTMSGNYTKESKDGISIHLKTCMRRVLPPGGILHCWPKTCLILKTANTTTGTMLHGITRNGPNT